MPIVVFLVHGTFTKSEALEREALGAALRAELDEGSRVEFVPWSAWNTHRARLLGAKKLETRILALPPDVPVLLVGHSHGGNLALYSLRSQEVRRRVRAVLCFATPFVDVAPRSFRFALRLASSSIFLPILPLALLVGMGFGAPMLMNPLAVALSQSFAGGGSEGSIRVLLYLLLLVMLLASFAFFSLRASRGINRRGRRWLRLRQLRGLRALRLPRAPETSVTVLHARGDRVVGTLRRLDRISDRLMALLSPRLSLMAGGIAFVHFMLTDESSWSYVSPLLHFWELQGRSTSPVAHFVIAMGGLVVLLFGACLRSGVVIGVGSLVWYGLTKLFGLVGGLAYGPETLANNLLFNTRVSLRHPRAATEVVETEPDKTRRSWVERILGGHGAVLSDHDSLAKARSWLRARFPALPEPTPNPASPTRTEEAART